jgi:hypothetical protein
VANFFDSQPWTDRFKHYHIVTIFLFPYLSEER